MINTYLPYLNNFLFDMEEANQKCEERIEGVKNEYFNVTPNLPRKLKKKRRKELKLEYSFLVNLKNFQENMFSW